MHRTNRDKAQMLRDTGQSSERLSVAPEDGAWRGRCLGVNAASVTAGAKQTSNLTFAVHFFFS